MSTSTADTRVQPQQMSWSQAAKEYFSAHRKSRARWLLLLSRWIPAILVAGTTAEDAMTFGLGVWNDIFFVPLAAWNLYGIRKIRRASTR